MLCARRRPRHWPSTTTATPSRRATTHKRSPWIARHADATVAVETCRTKSSLMPRRFSEHGHRWGAMPWAVGGGTKESLGYSRRPRAHGDAAARAQCPLSPGADVGASARLSQVSASSGEVVARRPYGSPCGPVVTSAYNRLGGLHESRSSQRRAASSYGNSQY
jgi:hypothetical protein